MTRSTRRPHSRKSSQRTAPARRRRAAQRWKTLFATIVIVVVVAIVADYALARCDNTKSAVSSAPRADYTNVISPEQLPMEILNYSAMTVGFNPETHIPNYVAWELTGEHSKGTLQRSDRFAIDENVKGCASPDDYRHSGYDRGHMAPAGDMKWSRKAMDESFFMTNIVPQNNALNRGVWNRLEEKCRQRAVRDSAIVIVTGPVPGDPVAMHIGYNQVAVPERFFKVILSPYATPPVAIGFIVPNGATKGGMQPYAMSVDQVEEVTGYDFFSDLPDEIETVVESKCNFTRWSQMK